MTAAEVDTYLAEIDEPKRSTLETVRRSIRAVVPEAEEGISYGMPPHDQKPITPPLEWFA